MLSFRVLGYRVLGRPCVFLAVAVLLIASGCTGTATLTAEDRPGSVRALSPEHIDESAESPGGEQESATALEPRAAPAPQPSSTPEPTPTVAPGPTPESTSAFFDERNRPLDEQVAALATIDVVLDPKRVTDRVSLDSTWWGLGSDVYNENATPAGPIPAVGDPAVFCSDGYLEGSPQGTQRASRDWTAESLEYRSITVGASAMIDEVDAADSMKRHQLLLANCDNVISVNGDSTMQVVDSKAGPLLIIGGADSDLVLVYSHFASGSLAVTVYSAGDASMVAQLVADVEYALQATVFAIEAEVDRVGAVSQLRPDLQAELAELDAYCRGYNKWDTSVGRTQAPLQYFEDIVSFFDGVEPPTEIEQQFQNFQTANAEMLAVVRLEPDLTDNELGDHPAWVELRERYAFTQALAAVWEFGRSNC